LALVLLLGAAPAMADLDPTIPELDRTAAVYKLRATADVDSTIAGVERLLAALQNEDVAAARQGWINARAGWERSEIFTGTLFPDLDKSIDSWPNGKTGFHAIEVKLFGRGGELPVAETEALLQKLKGFRDVYAKQSFSAHMVMVGLASLAFEIGESKAKGGESAISGTSLNDMQHNVEGLSSAWTIVFADYVAKKDHYAARDIGKQIDGLKALVAVPSLDQVDPAKLEQQSETLAASFADVAVSFGWRAPGYTDTDE
jgi:iron uptake system EfeUOB component EfeO/EfeM